MTIGQNIKRIRQEKGITQKQLAESCNLSVNSIQGYEGDKYKPKIEQLERIAFSLGVLSKDINITLKWNEEHDVQKLASESAIYDAIISTFGDDVAETLNDFLSLNDEGQQKVRDYIDDLTEIKKYTK